MTNETYPPQPDQGLMKFADYQREYQRSLDDPDGFWGERAHDLDWVQFPSKVKNTSFARDSLGIKWFEDGILNVSTNCIDRHLETKACLLYTSPSPRD